MPAPFSLRRPSFRSAPSRPRPLSAGVAALLAGVAPWLPASGAALVLASLAMTTTARAQSPYYFTVNTGDWETPTDWSTGAVPTASSPEILLGGLNYSPYNGPSSPTVNVTAMGDVGSTVDNWGTLNIAAGASLTLSTFIEADAEDVSGSANVTGTMTVTGQTNLGSYGSGHLTIDNGGVFIAGGGIALAQYSDGSDQIGVGTITINTGGMLQTSYIDAGQGNSTVTLAGGTLQATAAETAVIYNNGGGNVNFRVTVTSTIDSNGFDIGFDTGLSGVGGIIKIGAGDLTFSVANSFTGGITVNAGTVTAGASGAFVNNTPYTVNTGGTLDLGSFNLTASSLSGTGGSVTLGTATLTVAPATGTATTFAGVISGTGGLTVNGTGTGMLTLAGINTYTGTTSITGGTLSISADNNLGDSANAVILNGGALQTTATFSTARAFILGTNGGTFDVATGTLTAPGLISSTGALTKIDTGTLILSGLNTYQGGTNINGGTISISSDSNLGLNTAAVNLNGGTLQTTATFSTSRATTLGASGGTFDVTTGTLTDSGVISSTGALTKTGVGTLILSGTNTYQGETDINGGVLSVAADGNLGNGGAVNLNGGTLQTTATFSTSRATALGASGGTFDITTGTLTDSGNISGSGALTKIDTGTLILSGTNSYVGATDINGGVLSVATDGNLGNGGAVNLNGGTLQTTATFSTSRATALGASGGTFDITTGTLSDLGLISGAGALTKIDTGVLTLSGTNSYQGGTSITGGTLSISADDNLGLNTTAVNLNGGTLQATATFGTDRATALGASGGTFDITTGILSDLGVISGAGALTKIDAGMLTLSGTNTYQGGTNINGGTISISSDSNLGFNTAAVNMNGGTLQVTSTFSTGRATSLGASGGTFDVTTGILTDSGIISGGGSLTEIDPGTLKLSGTNTYQGGTNINGGTFSISSDSNLGLNTAAVNMNGGTLQTTASFITARATDLGPLGGTFDVTGTLTDSGVISGSGSLTKSGLGVLTLKSANTYGGATTISGGTITAGIANALPTGTALSVTGTFDLAGFNQQVAGVTGSGNVTDSGAAVTFTVNSGAADNFAGTITGANLALTVNSGVLTLANANTYGGATTISGAGQIDVGTNNALPTGTALSIPFLGTLDLAGFNQQVASVTGGGAIIDSGAAATFTVNNSTADGADVQIMGANLAFTKTGLGTLTLIGPSTYGGATTISAGTIADDFPNALPMGTALSVTGSLDLSGFSQQVGSVTGSGTVTDSGAAAFFTVNNAAADSFGGTITGSNLSLVKSGTGTLTLSGTSTYGGTTGVQEGLLQVDGSLGNTTVTIEDGATLGGKGTITGAVTIAYGGVLAPGDGPVGGPGTLTVGALTLNSGSISNYQLGTSGVIGSNTSDLTVVNGNLTLAGTLNVGSLSGFGPGAYQLFQYSGALTNNGFSLGNVPATYAAANFVMVTGVAHEIDLLVVPNAGTAPIQFWDGATTTGNGTIHGGSGTWSNFATNFTSSDGQTNATWQNGIAVFAPPSAGPGASTVTLSGPILFSGLMFTGDDYTIVSDGVAGTSFTAVGTPTNISNLASITVSAGKTATIAAAIGGTAGLSVDGAGTLILTAQNTFTGGTTVSAGTLQIGDGLTTGTTIASSGQVQVGGSGTLAIDLSTGSTFGNAVNDGGAVNAIASGANTLSGLISGGGAFNQNGHGTTILTGANTYSGTTTVNAGTLQIGDGTTTGTTIASSSQVVVGANGTLAIDLTANQTFVNAVNNGGTINAIGSGKNTLSGIISGAGAFNQNGPGLQSVTVLTAANTYTGVTTVNAGTLQIGDGSTPGASIASSGQVQVEASGGLIIDLNSGETFPNAVNDGGAVFTDSPGTNTLSGIISGAGVFRQNGTLTILTGANSYTGGTSVGDGTLQIGDGTTAGTTIANSGQVQVAANTALAIDLATGETFANAVNNGGAVNAIAAGTNTLSGNITGGGVFNQNGAGTTILTGANSYSGETTISAGTLQIGNGAMAGSITGDVLDNAALVFNRSDSVIFAGNITGSGSLTQNGSGTLILTGTNNNYAGGTTINSGAIQIDNDGELGSSVGGVTLNGGTLQGGFKTHRQITLGLSGGTIASTSGQLIFLYGQITGVGPLTLNDGGSGIYFLGAADNTNQGDITVEAGFVALDAPGHIALAGNVTINQGATVEIQANEQIGSSADLLVNGRLLFDSSSNVQQTISTLMGSGEVTDLAYVATLIVNNSGSFSGVIDDGSGTVALTKQGIGDLILTGDNTYTGGTTISGGTLQIGNGGTAGSITGNVIDNGTLLFTRSDSVTFGGIISGTGTVTKAGTGTLTLTGASTYQGPTEVNVGTLLVNGSLAAQSTVTVASAATLGGTGTIAGTVNVLAGGNLNPGGATAPGTLTIGTLVLNIGANSTFRLAQPDVAGAGVNDLVNVTGNLTIGGILNFTPLAGFGLGSYPLFTYSGTLTDNGFSAINGLTGYNGTLVISTPGEVDLLVTLGLAQYWDGVGPANDGIVAGGKGNWNTTTLDWTNVSGTTNAKWASGTAVFAGPGGAVTLTSAVSAEALIFESTGYTIGGSFALSLIGPKPTISVSSAGTSATITAKLIGSGGLTANGAGTLIMDNTTNSYSGGTAITNGTVQIGTATTAGSIGAGTIAVSNGGTLSLVDVTGSKLANAVSNGVGGLGTLSLDTIATTTLSGALTDGAKGQLALTQSGAKTTILTNAGNTDSGATTVSAGVLQIGTATVAGSIGARSAVDVGSGGTLALFDVSGNVFANNITNGLGGTGLVSIDATASLTLSGALADGAGTLALTKSGTGTTTLTGADAYSGATNVTAGTLQIGNGTTGNLTSGSPVTVSASGTLTTDLAGGSTLASNITLGTATASLKAIQTGVNTLSGVVSGTGTFNQNGTGHTILTNAETYTGATTVNAGILEIDGSLPKASGGPSLPLPGSSGGATGGPVTVNKGGTLGGSGTIPGAITLKSGGAIEPGIGSLGTSGTTLNAGSLIWNGGGKLTLQLADGADDALALTGALTKGTAGTYTLDLINAGLISTSTYNLTLVTFASSTFTAANFTVELPVNYTGTLVKTSTSLEIENLTDPPPISIELPRGDDLPATGIVDSVSTPADFTVAATPEPGSATLLAFGGGALLGWRRRRRA